MNNLVSNMLGYIHPLTSFPEDVDTLTRKIDSSGEFNDIERQSLNIRLGASLLYGGDIEASKNVFLDVIGNIQMSSDDCSTGDNNDIYIAALIGRALQISFSQSPSEARSFCSRIDNLISEGNYHSENPLLLLLSFVKGNILSFCGDNVEAITLLEDAERKTKCQENSFVYLVLSSCLLTKISLAKFRVRDYNNSLAHLDESIILARQVNFKYGEAVALRRKGIVNQVLRNMDNAIEYLNQSYELFDSMNSPLGQIQCLSSLGRCYFMNERKHAEFCFSKGIEIAKSYKLESELGQLYSRMGDIMMVECRYNTAEKFYQKDFDITCKDSSERKKAYAYRNLGRIQHLQNKLIPAAEALTKAVELFEQVGDNGNSSNTALRLCQCLIDQGNISAASKIEKKVRATFGTGETFEAALSDMMLGMILRAEGKYEAAYQQLKKSLAVQSNFPPAFSNVKTRLELALTFRDLNDNDQYLKFLKEVIQSARQLRIHDIEHTALDMLRDFNEKEWTRMRNVVYLGVAYDSQETSILNVSVLFADIRNYTELTEATDVSLVAEFVNDFFNIVSNIAYTNGGIVNKYLGDCVMCLFGLESAITSDSEALIDQATSAYQCALDIHHSVQLIRHRYDFASSVEVGIGIATGPVVAGHFGSRQRSEFTVIGSTVNLASRLQGHASDSKAILCSNTAKLLDSMPGVVSHDSLICKGYDQPVASSAIMYSELCNSNVESDNGDK